MSDADIATLIGVLAVFAQTTFAGINYWKFRQPSSSTSATTTQVTVTKAPVRFHSQSRYKGANRLIDINKLFYLSLLMFLLYGIIGFCLAILNASFWLWLICVLMYNLNLACLITEDFNTLVNTPLKPLLINSCFMSVTIAVYQLIVVVKARLPISIPLAIGLSTAINTLVMIIFLTKSFGRVKAVSISSSLSGFGLLLGWMAQNFSP